MSRNYHDILYRVAETQHGLFTARQAVEAGFTGKNHHYHIKTGNWEKEHRGIYRLKNFPYEVESQYALWSLWSCNRKGNPQGVYSYETALSIYDLTDSNPAKIHMTVPPDFRRSAPIPGVLRLYTGRLKPSDCRMMSGYRVTTPTRTLYDVINSNHLQEWIITQAVKEGLERGLYPKSELARYGIIKKVKYYEQRPDEWG